MTGSNEGRPHRERTRAVRVGRVQIGGGAKVAVQSMLKCRTSDVERALKEIEALERAGCDIVRVAVRGLEEIPALREIRGRTKMPLVADVHFDPKVALASIEAGVDKIRVNPGTIRDRGRLVEVLSAARERGVAVRVGVNSGSLPRDIAEKYPSHSADALVAAAERGLKAAEEAGLEAVVVSLKSSDVMATVEAYRRFASLYDMPLHLGITEAGPPLSSASRSGVGLGILLAEGIGDTIRVSATGPSVVEVEIAYEILCSLGLRSRGPFIISCPTCGRLRVSDLPRIVEEVKSRLYALGAKRPIKVAVMGCEVNGPGEAREADVGIACGSGFGVLFRKGRVVGRVPEGEMVEALVAEVERILRTLEE